MGDVEKNESGAPSCPRRATQLSLVIARSPVCGVWEMFLCTTRFYSWRSTEPDSVTRAEAMDPRFRIDPAKISQGRPMPEIPPLIPKR